MDMSAEERIAAYLDGEMDDAAAAAFEAEIAGDPALAARVATWRAADQRIAAAFAPVADMLLPAELFAKLSAPVAVPAANDNPDRWRRFALPLGGALAASLAIGLFVAPRTNGPAERDLNFALETGRSLEAVRLADGRTVTPTMTVRAGDGRFCREYRDGDTVALACRTSGRWVIEAKGKGSGPAGQGEIMTASGADASALDAAYARLKASDPLGAAEESALMSKDWSGN